MRIALVTDTFYPAVDGVTTTIKAVADRMIDTGHVVRFVAPGPGLASYRRSLVVRTTPLAKTATQVRHAIDSFSPDAVVVFDPGRLGRRALDHAHATGLPSLLVQQSAVTDPTTFAHRLAARADRVLVTSSWLAGQLPGSHAEVWVPGVDAAAFTPALRDPWLHQHWSRAKRLPRPLVVVGYAGRLARPHGVRRLAALGELTGVRSVLIGDGPQRGWLKDHLPDAKLTGTLGTGDLAIALATLDVLVHPGEREGCGHVLREAAASGVPVVAPRSGAAAEVVHHLETGLLYAPGRDEGLADALAAVVADPQRRLLGEHARRVARERTWGTAADELIARLPTRRSTPAA